MAHGETYQIRLDHYGHRVRMIAYVAAALLGEIACIAAGVFSQKSTAGIVLKALTFTQVIATSVTLVLARAQFEWEAAKLRAYLGKHALPNTTPLKRLHQALPRKPELLWRASLYLLLSGGLFILIGSWEPVAMAAPALNAEHCGEGFVR